MLCRVSGHCGMSWGKCISGPGSSVYNGPEDGRSLFKELIGPAAREGRSQDSRALLALMRR